MSNNITLGTKNRPIKCTLFHTENSSRLLIIAPAMGTSQRFYYQIAEYFIEKGYTVITFEYFGMFKTKQTKSNSEIHILDWGFKDLAAVIDYAAEEYPLKNIFFLGHSVGGQIFPLAYNSNKVTAACMIAAQNASKYNWSGFSRFAVNIFWHLIIPFCTRFLKGLPGWAYGGRYELHPVIAHEWGTWGRNQNGMLGTSRKAKELYQKLNVPVKFFSFHDDTILAPKASVEQLYRDFGSSKKEHEHISKKQTKEKTIGHFNFFKKEFSFLWPKIVTWFDGFSDS